MRSSVRDLHYEYCVPKPKYHYKLWDDEVEKFPSVNDAETQSIDIYCHVVV